MKTLFERNMYIEREDFKVFRGTGGLGEREEPGDILSDIGWFSTDYSFAEEFGDQITEYIIPGSLNLYNFDEVGGFYTDENGNKPLDEEGYPIEIGFLDANPDIVQELIERGYDGAIDGDGYIIALFDPGKAIPV